MIINEHRYSKEDTVNALEAYYSFFTKTVIMHYAPLPIAAVCGYLYYTSGLKRFVVFAIIFLLLFLMRYAQIALGAKYDAMRMNEETADLSKSVYGLLISDDTLNGVFSTVYSSFQ